MAKNDDAVLESGLGALVDHLVDAKTDQQVALVEKKLQVLKDLQR